MAEEDPRDPAGLLDSLRRIQLRHPTKTQDMKELRRRLAAVLSKEECARSLSEIQSWVDNCRNMLHEAKELAGKGLAKDGPEFTRLMAKAGKLGHGTDAELDKACDAEADRIRREGEGRRKQRLEGLSTELGRLSFQGCEDEERGQAIRRMMAEEFPDAAERRITAAIQRGRKIGSYCRKALQLGKENGSRQDFDALLERMRKDGLKTCTWAPQELERSFQQGRMDLQGRSGGDPMEPAACPAAGKPAPGKPAAGKPAGPSPAVPEGPGLEPPETWIDGGVHRNSIGHLQPADKWTFLFDETGIEFSEDAAELAPGDPRQGRGVLLLVPGTTQLPGLPPGWHAVDESQTAVRKVWRTLLTSECGILGLPCSALPRFPGDHWFACIETLMDLALRLLPVDGRTAITLLVEQRHNVTPSSSEMLRKTCGDVLHHLSHVFPERAERITLDGRIIEKDSHPWNGYVDAAAYSWSTTTRKTLSRQTGWIGACLWESNEELKHLDILTGSSLPTPAEWERLLGAAAGQPPGSCLNRFLAILQEHLRGCPGDWRSYHDHLLSSGILSGEDPGLRRIRSRWLLACAPPGTVVPGRLRQLATGEPPRRPETDPSRIDGPGADRKGIPPGGPDDRRPASAASDPAVERDAEPPRMQEDSGVVLEAGRYLIHLGEDFDERTLQRLLAMLEDGSRAPVPPGKEDPREDRPAPPGRIDQVNRTLSDAARRLFSRFRKPDDKASV